MKILVADDHELFLKGLELILSDLGKDIELEFAKNYNEIFEIIYTKQDCDLILTDLAMPGALWLDAIQKIHSVLPETPIIILSAVFDREIVQKTLDIGVSGYIPKTSSNAVIIGAVNLVLSGGLYIPPELLYNTSQNELTILKEVEMASQSKTTEDNIRKLTSRQIEVIKLISKGFSNKQIAYELKLTEGTIKLHVTAILKLLNVYNRTSAVLEAVKLGLIKNDK